MDFKSAKGQHFAENQPLLRKITDEAREQPELQLKKKLSRVKTGEEEVEMKKTGRVDDPRQEAEFHVKETVQKVKKKGSESDKIEKRDVYDHYTLGKLLGKGGYGCVYAGIRLIDGKKVALKIMDKKKYDKCIKIPGDTRSLPVEVALMELVCKPPHCPFVIQLLEWFETPNAIILVLERPDPCVDLYDFSTTYSMTEAEIQLIMLQVILAVCHCHKRGVFHRDIKDENVLVNTENLEVKLIDFGLGDLHKDSTYTELAGTKIYTPPEFYVEKEYKAEPFTVWGLGVLLYILYCGIYPFDGQEEIVEGHLYIPDKLPEASQDLILWCLQRDPKRRPTLNQILGHHWFSRQGQHFAENQPLWRKMLDEARKQPWLWLNEKLCRKKTVQKVEKTKKREVDDPLEEAKLQPKEKAKQRGSENDKSEKRVGPEKLGQKNQTDDEYMTNPGDTCSLPVEVALLELTCNPPHCPFVIQMLECFETLTTIIFVLEQPDPRVENVFS